jgi:hydrogenase/urease accessory protein HupE
MQINLCLPPNWTARAPLQIGRLLLALTFVSGGVARAHDPGLSVATARPVGAALTIHLAMARSDAERLVLLDANRDGRITDAEFHAALPQLQTVARHAFKVTASGKVLVPADVVVRLDLRDGVQFQIPFQGVTTGAVSIQAALLEKLPRGHRQFFSLRDQDQKVLVEQMLDASRSEVITELVEHPSRTGQPHSFREFIGLGVNHIATGYDHLLFLLGLLLIGGSLRAALQIITSFTLAHSITLALATLNLINIPSRIIEPLIAASIVFVGLQNILARGVEKRWLLTFGFGLVHGCGFASALRDLGLGANGSSLVVPLVSFNLGVELGQSAIAALALPCIWKCQTSPVFARRFVPIGSMIIVLAGGYWLIERTVL